MNKKLFAAALIAMAGVFGTSAFAQSQNNTAPEQTQNCGKQECKKGKECRPEKCQSPFADLNLTAEQQKKIDELNAQRAEQHKNDKAQADAKKDQMKKDRKDLAKQRRADYLAKVKAILTPEQYVKFLENNFVNAGNKAKKDGGKFQKGMKGDFKRLDADAARDFKKAKGEFKGHKEGMKEKGERR